MRASVYVQIKHELMSHLFFIYPYSIKEPHDLLSLLCVFMFIWDVYLYI